MGKQKCTQCGKTLSSYNPGPDCYACTEQIVDDVTPVTGCTSFHAKAYRHAVQEMGLDAYNSIAFNRNEKAI
jgi:hypothetical protein